MTGNEPFYKAEALICFDQKNYSGVIALFDEKCIFYNDDRLLDEFDFDIKKTNVKTGKESVSFLDLYTKEKEFIQLECNGRLSSKYFLTERRMDLLIGKFEQRKAEKRTFNLVVKALEFGYQAPDKTEKQSKKASIGQTKQIRKPDELNSWNDLLTPIEWRDYYQSLSNPGKRVYDAILEGIVQCRDAVLVDDVKLTNEAVGVIYHYILWDNPAIFCIGEYAMWRAVTENGKHIKITSLCGSKEDETALRHEVLAEVKKILSRTDIYGYSAIQKEKYVHDYIIKNWPYDESCGDGGARLEPYTVYGALVQKTAVCEGFAKTAKLLLELLGVHTMVVSGTIISKNAGHAWNAVEICGKHYQLDITFDLGQSGGAKYAIRYDYFNVPDEDLIDRTWNDKNVVWICKDREHSYPACVGGLVDNIDDLHQYIYKELHRHKAYMYVKLSGSLGGKKNKRNWIQEQFDAVHRADGRRAKAVTLATDIKDLFVIAVNY